MTHDLLSPLLAPDAPLREVGRSLYSLLDPAEVGAPYDGHAAAYDRMVSNATYMRIAWGVARDENTSFIRAAFDDGDGPVVDVAAGSCVDSAAVYVETRRPTVVLDRSIAMLEHGRERLTELAGHIPDHVVFLQADAAETFFRPGAVGTVLCHGAYHLFPGTAPIVREWTRVLEPGGGVFVSSLTLGRFFGDRYLGLLHRAGGIEAPRSSAKFVEQLGGELGAEVEFEASGNFTYARARRPA